MSGLICATVQINPLFVNREIPARELVCLTLFCPLIALYLHRPTLTHPLLPSESILVRPVQLLPGHLPCLRSFLDGVLEL